MTLTNGCVQFATNHLDVASRSEAHVVERVDGRPLFRSHGPGARNGDIVDEVAHRLEWEPIEAEPGDVVVFDSFVPHFSLVNGMSTNRRALFVTFNRSSEGAWYEAYYARKRSDADNPMFHVSTPTFVGGE